MNRRFGRTSCPIFTVYEIHAKDAFYRTDARGRNSSQSTLYVRECTVRHREPCTSESAMHVRGCTVRQRVQCTSEVALYVRGCTVRQRVRCTSECAVHQRVHFTSEGALYFRACSVRQRVQCTSESALYVRECIVRQRVHCTSDRPTSHFRQADSPHFMALVQRTSKHRKWTRSQIVTSLRYRMDNVSGSSRVLYACHIEIEKPVLDISLPVAPVQKLETSCTCINLLARTVHQKYIPFT